MCEVNLNRWCVTDVHSVLLVNFILTNDIINRKNKDDVTVKKKSLFLKCTLILPEQKRKNILFSKIISKTWL